MILSDSNTGNFIITGGKRYSYFAGNNYLGLANHPAVKEAAINSVRDFGTCFSASRQTTGTSALHLQLEKELSDFKEKEDSVIFASGYLGNRILLYALRERYSAIFMDEFSHPSITDGIPHELTGIFRYNHLDPDHLETLLQQFKTEKPLIITDGVFALTGEIAPLDRIYKVALRYNSLIVVDDAHSTGVLGRKGKGTPEYFDLDKKAGIYQSDTLSKALGSYGGFISADKDLIDLIRKESPVYKASTSLPPPVVAAGLESLKILTGSPGLRVRLLELAGIIRRELISMGFNTSQSNTQIIPLIMPSGRAASDLSAFLRENNIVVPVMDYPVLQKNSMLRIAVSAVHTIDQIDDLLEKLKNWKMHYGKAYC